MKYFGNLKAFVFKLFKFYVVYLNKNPQSSYATYVRVNKREGKVYLSYWYIYEKMWQKNILGHDFLYFLKNDYFLPALESVQ